MLQLENTAYLDREIHEHCSLFVDQVRLLTPLDRVAVILFDQELSSSRVAFYWRAEGDSLPDSGPVFTPASSSEKRVLNLPLYDGEGRIGTVLLHDQFGLRLGRQDTEIIYRISEELAMRLENAELNRRIQGEAAETAVLDEIARIVTFAPEIGTVYDRFVGALKKLIDFQRVNINLIDLDQGYFVKKFLGGAVNSGRPMGNNRHPYAGQVEYLIDTGRTLIRDNIAEDLRFPFDQQHLEVGLRSSIAVPIFSQERIIGIMCLRSPKVAAFGRREQSILERLAERIAPALDNAMLAQRLQGREKELAALAQDKEVATGEGGSGQSNLRRADLAHALRSPLTSIKGYASTLLGTDVDWSDDLEREFLETIDREADRLNQAVSDLLDTSPDGELPG